jgi:hypothetical protein
VVGRRNLRVLRQERGFAAIEAGRGRAIAGVGKKIALIRNGVFHGIAKGFLLKSIDLKGKILSIHNQVGITQEKYPVFRLMF